MSLSDKRQRPSFDIHFVLCCLNTEHSFRHETRVNHRACLREVCLRRYFQSTELTSVSLSVYTYLLKPVNWHYYADKVTDDLENGNQIAYRHYTHLSPILICISAHFISGTHVSSMFCWPFHVFPDTFSLSCYILTKDKALCFSVANSWK